MAVTAYWYGNAMLSILNKEIDWAADAIKVSLHTVTYTPDQDAHNYYDDVTNEVGASGTYSAGGALIGTPTIGYTAGTNVIKLDGDDVAWTGATITARYAVIYDSTPGSAATNPLIAYVDFGANVTSTAGTFTITWAAGGILTITPAAPA
jgi:hypothetical protein